MRVVDKLALAEHIHVSPRTIEKWTQERKIPFIRLGHRCVRYDLDEIEALLADKSVPVGGTGARKKGSRK